MSRAAEPSGRRDVPRAALWMAGAVVAFSLMAVAGRAVSTDLDTFEIMLYRSLTGLVVVVTVASATGHLREVSRHRIGLHGVRNLLHFTGQNLWFFALPLIPLAQLFALEFTAPLWALVLSPLVLGERPGRVQIMAAAVGFAGILVIARPGIGTIGPGVIAAVAAALCFAATAVSTRRLTRHHSLTAILFWMTAMQLGLGVLCAGVDGAIALPAWDVAAWLVVIGLCGLTAHLCIASALALAPATVVMPLEFARLPLIALIGVAFYGEAIDLWLVAGAALILGANYVNVRSGQAPRRTPPPTP